MTGDHLDRILAIRRELYLIADDLTVEPPEDHERTALLQALSGVKNALNSCTSHATFHRRSTALQQLNQPDRRGDAADPVVRDDDRNHQAVPELR